MKIILPEQHFSAEYDRTAFPGLFNVTYLTHLEFENRKAYETVCGYSTTLLPYLEPRQIWLGTYYRKEIEAGFCEDLTLFWIGKPIGYGIYANRPIACGSFIGEYTGIVKKRRFLNFNINAYCFQYLSPKQVWQKYAIDAEKKGNLLRFINHGDEPNLEPLSVPCGPLFHVILIATRDIAPGEELTYDYGERYWDSRSHLQKLPR